MRGVFDPVLDPDRDQARQLLQDELTHPDYHRAEPIISRILNWIIDRLDALIQFIPGSSGFAQLALVAVVIAAVLAIAFALRGRRRAARLRTSAGPGSVFDDSSMTAAQYRARAAAALAAGDFSAGLLDSYRAIAASADERALLDEAPGRTAHEIAIALVPTFPDHGPQVGHAADLFDSVRYGEHRATEAEAVMMLDLDTTLASTRPIHQRTGADPAHRYGGESVEVFGVRR